MDGLNSVTAHLTDEQVKTLMDLAAKRGVDANTVLQQAIGTEKLIDENVSTEDTLQIKKSDNTVATINFS